MSERVIQKELVQNKKAFVLDLDGTIYVGEEPIVSSIEFINQNRNDYKFYFMTNNTSKSKVDYLEKLSNMGLKDISLNDIISPVDALLVYLKKHEFKCVYCLGTDSFKNELISNGISICGANDPKIDCLIMSYDTEINYSKITEFSLLLNQDIPYVATHNDIVCPHEQGFIPDVGSFVKMFEASNGRSPSKYFGKPNVELLEPILQDYSPEELIVSGDRLYTDKLLADNAGIDFALVLTGETTMSDVKMYKSTPQFVLDKLADLKL